MKSFKYFFEDNEDSEHYLRVDDKPFKKSIPISDDDFKEIKHLLADRGSIDELITKIGEQSNLKPDRVKDLLKILLSQSNTDTVIEYLHNREDIGVTKDELVSSGNIFTAFGEVGFEEDTIKDLYNKQFSEQPVMGRGEMLMVVLLKGCTKPPKGDILIDGELYDVKGKSARLRGQTGYGDGASASIYWSNEFTKLSNEKDLNLDVPEGGTNDFNILINSPGYAIRTGFELLNNNIITAEYFSTLIKNGLKSVFSRMEDFELTFVDDLINEGFEAGYKRFITNYKIALLHYYLRIERMENTGLLIFNEPQGNVAHINSSTSPDDVFRQVGIGLPGFGAKAGPQGSAASITTKTKIK